MDPTRLARLFAAVRHRKRWRQVDVARVAKISQSAVSRAERGRVQGMSLGTLDRIARTLEIDLRLEASWHGGRGDSLIDRGHAAIVEWVVATLRRHGWETIVEYTFNHFGERGSVDILAFHAATRALLIVEVKTRLTDLQAFLSSLGRKLRIVPGLVPADRGWDSAIVGSLAVVAGTTANRLVVQQHRAVFDGSLPGRAAEARRWIRAPDGPLAAIWFVDSARAPAKTSAGRVRR